MHLHFNVHCCLCRGVAAVGVGGHADGERVVWYGRYGMVGSWLAQRDINSQSKKQARPSTKCRRKEKIMYECLLLLVVSQSSVRRLLTSSPMGQITMKVCQDRPLSRAGQTKRASHIARQSGQIFIPPKIPSKAITTAHSVKNDWIPKNKKKDSHRPRDR